MPGGRAQEVKIGHLALKSESPAIRKGWRFPRSSRLDKTSYSRSGETGRLGDRGAPPTTGGDDAINGKNRPRKTHGISRWRKAKSAGLLGEKKANTEEWRSLEGRSVEATLLRVGGHCNGVGERQATEGEGRLWVGQSNKPVEFQARCLKECWGGSFCRPAIEGTNR